MKDCRTDGCKEQIEDKYIYCIGCADDRKREKEKMVDVNPKTPEGVHAASGVEEFLKNINIAVWRLVNYKEAEMIKAGLDPKKIRDDRWEESKK